jgi:2-phospho-L-lactate guanylyltransferase
MPTAVVPVKSIDLAKSRLAAVLDPARRRALAAQMLRHVLDTLRDAGLSPVCVASDDPEVLTLAAELGARKLSGVGDTDLNAAAATAARVVQADGATDLLLLTGDLPYLSTADITALIEAGRTSAVVIAEAKDGGTNALLLRPPTAIGFAFTTRQPSAKLHVELARKAGIEPAIVRRPGLARDIDTPADLANLATEHPAYRIFRHVA